MNKPWQGLFLGLWLLGQGGGSLQAPPLTRAEVVEIPQEPLFWAQPPAPEALAEVGTQVQTGGYLRTARPGKAQIQLQDGVMFRLGGDAVLELSDGDLKLQQGQIIAWAKPEGSSRRIQTPLATAAIRDSTVFIEQREEGSRIFSWAGEVEIRLPWGGQPVLLQAGEEIRLRPGMTELPAPEKMSRAALETRFTESELLNGFESDMPSRETIQKLFLP